MSLSIPQMDWIMAMYAKDHPKEFRFTPASEVGKEGLSMNLNVAWADVLIGQARERFMEKMRPKRRQAGAGRVDPGIREFKPRQRGPVRGK